MTTSTASCSLQGTDRKAALAMLLCALALLAASLAGVFPLQRVAVLLSDDGLISDTLAHRFARSQWTMGFSLAAFAWMPLIASGFVARLLDWVTRASASSFLAALFAATLGLTLLFQHAVLQPIPHVTDETCHYFQGRVFAAGRLYAPRPPCPEHFSQANMIMTDTGRWFARYLPGQAAILAAGFVAGTPWLMMPACSALCAVLLVLFAQRFYSSRTARLLGMFFMVSPMAIMLGASFMSHTSSLLFLLAAAVALAKAVEARIAGASPRGWATSCGAAAGMAALLRPTEIIVAALIGIFALALATPRIRTAVVQSFGGILLGTLPACVAVFAWNFALLGSAFAFNYTGNSEHVLFRSLTGEYGFGGAFTPRQAVSQTIWTSLRFDAALLGWPTALVFAPLAFLRKPNRADWVCAAAVVTVVAFYFFYSYYGAEYEARYYLLAMPFALVLVLRGLRNATIMAERKLGSSARTLVAALVAAFFLQGFSAYWLGYVIPVYGRDYEDTTRAVARAAERDGLSNAIVLIDMSGPRGLSYGSGFQFNDPLLQGSVIYARDLHEGNDCLVTEFPGRSVQRFLPDPDLTDGHFERLAGP